MKYKLVYLYLLDHCDVAGLYEPIIWKIKKEVGSEIRERELLRVFKHRVVVVDDKWYMRGFVEFQYGKLSIDSPPHKAVILRLSRFGMIDDVYQLKPEFADSKAIQNGTLNVRLRQRIIERDGLVCVYTGNQIKLEEVGIDHIVPVSSGGTDTPSNLVVCHRDMNRRKTNLSLEEFCRRNEFDLNLVQKRIIDRVTKELPYPSATPQDKDKKKEKVMDKDTTLYKDSTN